MEYWTGSWLFSCNRIFNMSCGARSTGKSFRMKEYIIKNFLEKNEQFIYIRRYDEDLKLTAADYFNDNLQKHEDLEIMYIGNQFYFNGKLAGYAVSINKAIKKKSVQYPYVTTLLFDEFIPEDGKYVGGKDDPFKEVEFCLNLYQTVARGYNKRLREDVKFFWIANAVTINNPYFLYWDLDKDIVSGKTHILRDFLALEMIDNINIEEGLEDAQFFKAIRGTRYGNYAVNNDFYLDTDTFIADEIPKHLDYTLTIDYDKYTYGVWLDKKENIYYMTEKYDPSCALRFALTNSAHKTNTILIQNNKSKPVVKLLKLAYENGQVRFSNQRAKNVLLLFLGL